MHEMDEYLKIAMHPTVGTSFSRVMHTNAKILQS